VRIRSIINHLTAGGSTQINVIISSYYYLEEVWFFQFLLELIFDAEWHTLMLGIDFDDLHALIFFVEIRVVWNKEYFLI
jgi:hypothetical protein